MKHLLTGFPGFLTSHLVKQIVRRTDEAEFVLLVLPSTRSQSKKKLAEFFANGLGTASRFEILDGDITDAKLGLRQEIYRSLTQTVTHVWHLAAIYDLAVPLELAQRVNITGTRHILDFCAQCSQLSRLNYISTCYVSGDRKGRIDENELDSGQGFKNHYERTKFEAEREVQRQWDTIPTTIFRPSIIVGNSYTGRTEKYDGPYYVFRLVQRLPSWVPVPNVGPGDAFVNLIPIDFAVQAMDVLGNADNTLGQVFHIADPAPMRARDILALALDHFDKPRPKGTIPASWATRAVELPWVRDHLDLPQEAIDYFNHPAHYDTSNTQRSLFDSEVRCPHLRTYLPRLLDYMALHPEPGKPAATVR